MKIDKQNDYLNVSSMIMTTSEYLLSLFSHSSINDNRAQKVFSNHFNFNK